MLLSTWVSCAYVLSFVPHCWPFLCLVLENETLMMDPHCPPSQAGEATLPPTPTPSTSTPTIQAEALVAWDQAEEIIQTKHLANPENLSTKVTRKDNMVLSNH